MPLQPIPGFIGGSYPARSKGVSAARSVNLFVELNPPNSKGPCFYPRFGKKSFATLPTPPHFGAWSNRTQVFLQAGGHVYELKEDATYTAIGTVQLGSNPTTMRSNGNQLLVVSGGKVYIATGLAFYQPIINFGRGQVSIAGNVVTWVAGDNGDTGFLPGGGGDVVPGNLFMVMIPTGPVVGIVVNVADNTHLSLDIAPGDTGGIAYQVGTEYLTGAMCECIDDYFIVNVPNTKTFRISNLKDGTIWDDVDKAEKSGSTDNIGAIANLSGNLALFGDTNSTELWGDSGNADFPFARISGSTLAIGLDAAWSVAKMWDGSLIGLTNSDLGNGVIAKSNGGAPQRISDHALENQIRKYAKTFDAVASTYLENGHSHYRIDFPAADKTWDWDDTSKIWCELGRETPQDEVYAADLGRYHVHVTWPTKGSMHLLFDYTSGKVWQMDPSYLDDDGVEIPIMRIAPHLNPNLEWTDCAEFALDCELGDIDPTLLGQDGKELIPTVQMSYSDDGGNIYSDPRPASLGRVGEYLGTYMTQSEYFDATANSQTNHQIFEPMPSWKSLGQFRIAKTFKVKSSAKMLRAIYNGLVSLTKGIE